MFPSAAPTLLAVQDEVRAAFGWSLDDDFDSATALSEEMSTAAPYGVQAWAAQARDASLRDVAARCHAASRVVVVGAAAAEEDVRAAAAPNTVFVAADGAAGAVPDHLALVAVVSDLDGGVHLDNAAQRGVTVVLHAHGDNREAWASHLATWAAWANPPCLVLTHQVSEAIEGMHNPGGFTDGDRAVCLLRWLGVPDACLAFVGFTMDRVGAWSGTTDPARKLEKLTWMAEVLGRLGLTQQALPRDEK